MTSTEHGWPTIDVASPQSIQRFHVNDHNLDLKSGPVGHNLAWLAVQIDHDVEQCTEINGFRDRAMNIRVGGVNSSDHRGAAAFDTNYNEHDWQRRFKVWASARGWSSRQTRCIRKLINFSHGALFWGADYAQGNKDYPHFAAAGSAELHRRFREVLDGGTVEVTVKNAREYLRKGTKLRKRAGAKYALHRGDKVHYTSVQLRNGTLWLHIKGGGYVKAGVTNIGAWR